MDFAQLATQPVAVPAWLLALAVLLFVVLELVRMHRASSAPDYHGEMFGLTTAIVKSHESTVSAVTSLAKKGEE